MTVGIRTYGEFTVCPAQRLYQRLDVVDFSLDCTHQDLLVLRSVCHRPT